MKLIKILEENHPQKGRIMITGIRVSGYPSQIILATPKESTLLYGVSINEISTEETSIEENKWVIPHIAKQLRKDLLITT